MRMKDKLAIVTAGASGMGAAGCRLFAENGATVAVVDINEERTQAVVDEITDAGGKAKGFIGNLADEADCKRVIAECVDWLGGLDVLWAHAGTPGPSKYEDMPMDEYNFAVDLNLTSAVICSGEAAPHIRKRGGGAILFTSSIGGLVGSTMSPVYSMAKFGIVGLTMSLAQRLAPDNIRVNAVCPGATDTPMMPSFFARPGDEDKLEENMKRVTGMIPLARLAQPKEIAHAAMWLLSDDASYVTGVPLPVDGGFVCR